MQAKCMAGRSYSEDSKNPFCPSHLFVTQDEISQINNQAQDLIQDQQESVTRYCPVGGHRTAEAQYNIGYMYENGLGTARDFQEALIWYLNASVKALVKHTPLLETYIHQDAVCRGITMKLCNGIRKQPVRAMPARNTRSANSITMGKAWAATKSLLTFGRSSQPNVPAAKIAIIIRQYGTKELQR